MYHTYIIHNAIMVWEFQLNYTKIEIMKNIHNMNVSMPLREKFAKSELLRPIIITILFSLTFPNTK